MESGWMKKISLLASGLFTALILSGSPASSQEVYFEQSIDEWRIASGVSVTDAGQKAALQAVAASFSEDAIAAGVDPLMAAKFSEAILGKGVIGGTADGMFAKWAKGSSELKFQTADAKIRALNSSFLVTQLERLPRVVFYVEPVPPKDFVIEINGEVAELTDRLEYAVDPGWVNVRVTRNLKPDCSWAGELKPGAMQAVNCKM